MKTKYKMSKGVTLIELIIVVALVGIVFMTVGSMMNFSMKSNKIVFDEYQVQSDMRLASQVVTEQIRSSSAVFMLNSTQFDTSDLKDGWNYFALSDDKKQIVQYLWDKNTSTRSIKPLVGSQSDLVFNMAFDKPKDDGLIVGFNLGATILDGSNHKVNLNADINAINTVVIDDAGTLSNPAVALAYRTDEIPGSEQIKVAVTMVLDCSGSMSFDMAGNKSPGFQGYNSSLFDPNDVRMDHLHFRGQVLIDKFASMENVYVSIIPFSSTANGYKSFRIAKDNKTLLKGDITSLTADGGTNTGDGIRRSYYQHLGYNSKPENSGTVLNYTILLVDGNPTYFTKTANNNSTHYTGSNDAQYLGGNGSDTSQTVAMEYIETLGNVLIKNGDIDMTTFVIGFTANATEVSRAESIAIDNSSHSTNQKRKGYYYSASDGQKLSEAFDLITDKILEDVWHIYGPNR